MPLILRISWTPHNKDLTIRCNSIYHLYEKLRDKDERGIIMKFIRVIEIFPVYTIENISYALYY